MEFFFQSESDIHKMKNIQTIILLFNILTGQAMNNSIEMNVQGHHVLGKMVFKKGLSSSEIEGMLEGEGRKLALASPIYAFQQGEFRTLRSLFPHLQEWRHAMIYFSRTDHQKMPTIIKQMSELLLPDLTILSLDNNNIMSVEAFGRFHAPSLDCLSLLKNHILTGKEIRKGQFPKLTRLYINIKDNQYLSEFGCRKLELISNEEAALGTRSERKDGGTADWIAKIQSPKLRRVLFFQEVKIEKLCGRRKKVLAGRYKQSLSIT